MQGEKKHVLIEIILSLALASTTSALFFPATLSIADYFNQPVPVIQRIYAWVFGVKFLSIPFYYYASLHYGRLRALTVGLMVMVLGLLGCAVASPSGFMQFFISMMIMAVGAASCAVIPKILIKNDVDKKSLDNYAAFIIATPLMIFPLIVIISAYLTSYFTWQGVLWVTFCFGVLNIVYAIGIQKNSNEFNAAVPMQKLKIFAGMQHFWEEMSLLITNALSIALMFAWMTISSAVFLRQAHLTPMQYAFLLLVTNFIPSLISVFFAKRMFDRFGLHRSMIFILIVRLLIGVLLAIHVLFGPQSDAVSLILCGLGVLTINTSSAGTLIGSAAIIDHNLSALSSFLCIQLAMLGGFSGSMLASFLHSGTLLPVGISMMATAVISLLIIIVLPTMDRKKFV
jgi:MFS family permease